MRLVCVFPILAFAVSATAGWAQPQNSRIAEASEALVGKPAPAVQLDLVDVSGGGRSRPRFDLGAQKGKVVFLAFWATWCEPCEREIPVLIEAQKEFGARGLVVAGITAEPSAEVKAYLADHGFNDFATAIDGEKSANRSYGIDLVPRLFVINREGIVVRMIRGLPGEGTIRKVLAGLL